MRTIFSILFFLAILNPLMAAETETLWTTGKIHVVLSILLTILVLIFVFLFVLERKISRLEKKI
jgi:hypothetical protein